MAQNCFKMLGLLQEDFGAIANSFDKSRKLMFCNKIRISQVVFFFIFIEYQCRVGLKCVIVVVVFPDHTYLLFYIKKIFHVKYNFFTVVCKLFYFSKNIGGA